MSTIRCVYHRNAPAFPATDQHPDAVRYARAIDGVTYHVDAIGGEPSEAEVRAVLNPPAPVPATISDRQFAHALKNEGVITHAEAMAFVQTGTIPAALQAVVDTIPDAAQREDAELLLAGATVFERAHPMTEALRLGMNWSADQTDQLWRDGVAL